MSDSPSGPHIAPYPLALVVCDACWRDPYTGKHTLIGTFSAISGESFPFRHPILTIYAALTDGVGRMPVKVKLVDVNDEREPVFEFEDDIEFPDPLAVLEFVVVKPNIEFAEPGEYRLQLYVNHEFAMERRIVVIALPKPEGEV